MTKIVIESYLNKHNLDFVVDEGLPEDMLDIKDVYVLPRERMIFDAFFRLDYNERQELTMREYQVFQPKTFEEFKTIISKII